MGLQVNYPTVSGPSPLTLLLLMTCMGRKAVDAFFLDDNVSLLLLAIFLHLKDKQLHSIYDIIDGASEASEL